MIRLLAVCAALAAPPVAAQEDLPLPPGAVQLMSRSAEAGAYALPVAAFDGRAVPTLALRGRVAHRTWRTPPPGGSGALLAPLRAALLAEGWGIVFECVAQGCGGADFLFGIEIAQTPDMYVNLRDFRFLAAMRDENQAMGILVSASPTAGHVQVVDVMRSPAAGN